ncbi:MAG: aldehyde ferredoxin oxidoreductase family protein [Desulfurococcaceae archaeon]
MVKGVAGHILHIDLSTGKIYTTNTDAGLIEKFVGGYGLAARLFYNYLKKHRVIQAFSENNPLIVMTGPLTGTSAFGAKTCIASRSPLTGTFAWAVSSGAYGLQLKRAGYDGIAIEGVSEKPIYIVIDDGHVELKPATDLWGLDVFETHTYIKRTIGSDFDSIAIGPAGEKLVKIAAVVTNERRVAGRTGLGAIMGFKRVKAIAVRGNHKVEVHDESELKKLNKEWLTKAIQTPRGKSLNEYGTGAMVSVYAVTGGLPIKNWTKGIWEHTSKLTGQYIMENYKKGTGKKVCSEGTLCSIACERVVKYTDPRFGDYEGKGPEYESICALGFMPMIGDPVAVVKLNELCDRLGVDSISAGAIIAWAMEAYEKGIITSNMTGGLELKWGNLEAVLKLIDMIVKRDGIGNTLAEGVKVASSNIGGRSEDFALHVKGLEVPYHDPRRWKSAGLIYATSNRGACHLQGMAFHVDRGAVKFPEYGIYGPPKNPLERAKCVIIAQNICAFVDSAGLCKFGTIGVVDFDFVSKVWSAVTGLKANKDTILRAGERVWLTSRFLNYQLGFKNTDDTLPKRFTEEPLLEGPSAGLMCDDLEESLEAYYKYRGISKVEDIKSKLIELELSELVEGIEKIDAR